jgi:hypothetical protein
VRQRPAWVIDGIWIFFKIEALAETPIWTFSLKPTPLNVMRETGFADGQGPAPLPV